MSSQLIMLAPSSMMIPAMAGMGITAMALAKNNTSKRSQSAELAIAMRL
jgi:hypothetical protein